MIPLRVMVKPFWTNEILKFRYENRIVLEWRRWCRKINGTRLRLLVTNRFFANEITLPCSPSKIIAVD